MVAVGSGPAGSKPRVAAELLGQPRQGQPDRRLVRPGGANTHPGEKAFEKPPGTTVLGDRLGQLR